LLTDCNKRNNPAFYELVKVCSEYYGMTNKKYHKSLLTRRRYGKRKPGKNTPFKPRIDSSLKSVFQKIGTPEPGPFVPDLFQTEALRLIKHSDVLVSAPTGSGKTWIASQAIQMYLDQGKTVWYASPLKALSNSIYEEFSREFGSSSCGILTGDRKENPDAPITVGTTEILRNQLYDAMHEGTSIQTDLVILDEAHYLNDPDRGVVWEETLIYLPPRIRLLMLSATISNAEEICEWLRDIRDTEVSLVRSQDRPVPLETLFLFSDGLIVPLGTKKGLSSKVKKHLARRAGKRRQWREKTDFGNIIESLGKLNLLPTIFYLKSRKECDRALRTCPYVKLSLKEDSELRTVVRSFLERYPHLKNHRQMSYLIKSRVASHHGGQLPYWKVLVENLMNRGLLNAIFSTSTVAAGVNFPARSVVLIQSDRFNGHEFADLTATEFHQMVGRAGRRGKDKIGFAVVIPGIHQNPDLIHELQESPPEPVNSQIQINFSMVLNLLLSHTPTEVKDLIDRSFASFQETPSRREKIRNRLWRDFKRHLHFLKETGFVNNMDQLTEDGYWASKLRVDQPLLISEAIRKSAMDDLLPEELAGALAPFVWDRSQEIDLKMADETELARIESIFHSILKSIKQIMIMKAKQKFDTPLIQMWPCAALYFWAGGVDWNELFHMVRVDEGDMASLIMRTADHLRQIVNLKKTHPDLADTAEKAIDLIMREPVYV